MYWRDSEKDDLVITPIPEGPVGYCDLEDLLKELSAWQGVPLGDLQFVIDGETTKRRWSLKRLLKRKGTGDHETVLHHLRPSLPPDDYIQSIASLFKKIGAPMTLGLNHRPAPISNISNRSANQQSQRKTLDAARSQSGSVRPRRCDPRQSHAKTANPRSGRLVMLGGNTGATAYAKLPRVEQPIAQRPLAQTPAKGSAKSKLRRRRPFSSILSSFFRRINTHVRASKSIDSKDINCITPSHQETQVTSRRHLPITNQDVSTGGSASHKVLASKKTLLQPHDASHSSSVPESSLEQHGLKSNDPLKYERTLEAPNDGYEVENGYTNAATVSNLDDMPTDNSEPKWPSPMVMDAHSFPENHRKKYLDSMMEEPKNSLADMIPTLAPSTMTPSPIEGETSTPCSSVSSQKIQQSDQLQSSPYVRQVDILRAEIQQLSLFDKCDVGKETSEDAINRPEDLEYEQDGEASDQGSGTGQDREYAESSSIRAKQSCNSTKRPNMYSGHGSDAEGSDEEEKERRKGPAQRKKKKKKTDEQLSRFACPYQAFNTSLTCLLPSSQNPTGGCKDISRLKQHLNRRHLPSSRCHRCWASFDTGLKLREHEAQAIACKVRTKPRSERFMSDWEEAEARRICRSFPEVEAWWNLFRLLNPVMRGIEVRFLKPPFGEYSPYYAVPEARPEHSSLSLSNSSHRPVAEAAASEPIPSLGSGSLPFDLFGLHDSAPDPSPWTHLSMQPSPLQALPEPAFEDPDRNNIGNQRRDRSNNEYASIDSSLDSNLDSPSSSNNAAPSLVSSLTADMSVSAPLQRKQLHRIEHLKKRNARTEEENKHLRQKAHETMDSLRDMDRLLDNLLDSEDVTGSLLEKISEVYSVLDLAKAKIQ